ncbi:MAG: hypothetical protein LLF96_09590 [Eubacteriales bacterium]|nr:hypothetical protein [Eubacteriales bacterium]
MFDRIRQGDIIYLKTFYGIERRLTIKAVGIVTQGAYFDEHNVDSNPPGSDLSEQREIASVAWKCTTPCVYPMSEAEMKNNVYNNTLYEEFNHTIGEKIIDLLG